MPREIVSQACGKTILTGEHIVVYGYPAVLLPLNNVFCECKIDDIRTGGDIKILALDKQTELSWEDIEEYYTSSKNTVLDSRLGLTLLSLKSSLDFFKQGNYPYFDLHLDSSIPMGGFGSSTAVAASIVRSMAKLADKVLSPAELYELLVKIETENGAAVSGADQYVVSHNMPIKFRKNTVAEEVRINTDTLNYFLIINSGTPTSTTKECIDFVAQQKESSPERIGTLFERLADVGERMIECFQKGDNDGFYNAIRDSGELLISLGVVSPQSVDLIRKLENLGGYLKVTGAGTVGDGGSGGILCFSNRYNEIEAFLKENNTGYLRVSI